MTCILHFGGKALDADAFIKTFPLLTPYRTQGRDGATDICFDLGTMEFAELRQQKDQAISFLKEHDPTLTAMRHFQGVERAVLDFAVGADSKFFALTNRLPLALIRLAAKIGLEIEISIYCHSEN